LTDELFDTVKLLKIYCSIILQHYILHKYIWEYIAHKRPLVV